ncbi:hypothetical protein D9758_013950 [Tetrapyrgos nigripes]|uniref:Uncharacterized protein n=1 Tax=Tetrapyrgos nigripes TaxID=182062 RepID=A0A8H5CHC2_9AGAR|nr:hypothetical protein D9758_013950 [Tetrapyrgos nigripes]
MMPRLTSLFFSICFASLVVTSPTIIVSQQGKTRAWPSGEVTCGSDVYTLDEVQAAVSAGVDHLDNPIGDNSYPHTFNNYEGLDLYCSGETDYNEYPIMSDGDAYDGDSPGADRVIFSDNGVYCAVVTHTGASGNDFVSCEGD